MPPNVVRYVIQYDACVGDIVYADAPDNAIIDHFEGDDLWRVDGGPVETSPMNYGRPDAAKFG
jgi:hypothetical protein